jgi:xylulokinase
VLCGLLEGLDLLAKQGIRLDRRLILTGGAARSRAFRQILSDLSGKAVWIAQITEAAAAGAAVQAAAALSNEAISKIARQWAPELKISEEPEATFPREAVRESYRIAIESQFGRYSAKARLAANNR